MKNTKAVPLTVKESSTKKKIYIYIYIYRERERERERERKEIARKFDSLQTRPNF